MPRVYVDRFADGRYEARISLRCSDCDEWMEFFGLPSGQALHGATVSEDKKELRVSIGTPATLLEYYEKAITALTRSEPRNLIKIPRALSPEQQWKKVVGK